MADQTTTNPVGASSSNPDSPTLGGSEVGTNTPAAQPSSASALIDAVDAFTTGLTPLVDQLVAAFPPVDPAVSKHTAKVGQRQLQVIQMVVSMLGTNPKVSTSTPDDINVVSNEADACSGLSKSLKALTATVDATGRLRLEANWQVASGALATARKLAPRNAALATEVADIDAVMALGPRVDQAAHAAVNAQAEATKADARAAKAHAKLAARTATAAALQHGTGDAVITQPAPTAPSAPAPGATPGTPGSTNIR